MISLFFKSVFWIGGRSNGQSERKRSCLSPEKIDNDGYSLVFPVLGRGHGLGWGRGVRYVGEGTEERSLPTPAIQLMSHRLELFLQWLIIQACLPRICWSHVKKWRWVSKKVTDQRGSSLMSYGTCRVENPGKQRNWITQRGEID